MFDFMSLMGMGGGGNLGPQVPLDPNMAWQNEIMAMQNGWQNMVNNANNLNPNDFSQTMQAMEQAGMVDSGAFKPLFGDTMEWSPRVLEKDPLLLDPRMMSGEYNIASEVPKLPGLPDIKAPIEEKGINAGMMDRARVAFQDKANKLTPEQYKQLMGMMPDSKDNYQPMPAMAPRVTPLNANMQMLAAGNALGVPQRPTLAQLIYGGR